MKQFIVDNMLIKKCSLSDVEELAQLNKLLIEDEKSDNTMNIEELKARMHGFLENDYDAYFFMEEKTVKDKGLTILSLIFAILFKKSSVLLFCVFKTLLSYLNFKF